jgi:hypothetical protein
VTLIGAGVIATIVGIVAFFLLGGGRDGQSESTSEPNDAATTATPTAS